jgi:hypothetical protein
VSSGEARLSLEFQSLRAAIRRILSVPRAARAAHWIGLGVLACTLFLGSAAQAARVTLAQFEGPRSTQLKWRVSGALKRGGHSVVPLRSPKPSAPASRFRSIAERYSLDAFITASASEGNDSSWTLTLSLRGANGEELSETITLRGSSLSDLVEEIRGNAASRLDEVLGGGSGSADADQPRRIAGRKSASDDEDEPAPPPRAAGKGRRASARASGGEVDLDADSGETRPARSASKGNKKGVSSLNAALKKQSKDKDSDTEEFNADGDGAASADESSSSENDEGKESEAPSESASEPVDEGGDSASASGKSKLPFVRLGVRAGFVSRSLTYEQDLYERLRTQKTGAGVYRLDASLFVFARSVREYFALIGSYEGAMFGDVQDADQDTTFGVRFSELQGGLRGRYPVDGNEVGLSATFGSMLAGLDDGGEADVPDFRYTFVRVAADGKMSFGQLSAMASLGLRVPTGYGEVGTAEWFPRLGGYGVEGSLGVEYRLSELIGIEASGSLRRFVLNMNSLPQDATGGVSEVAGGAVDLYLSGYIGVNFSL